VRFYNLPVTTAVLVVGVQPDSPAATAGLQDGDLIVSFDDQPVGSVEQLHRLLGEERIDRWATITVLRRYERFEFAIRPTVAK
ncbi:MAG: PDZ domain-containing protein, partial [Phycisphaerae bacterium]|nr:PDZ domain-containing protein [Phycisphaerae bacterium]